VVAAQQANDGTRVVVDVPPMGFAWVTAGGAKADSTSKRRSKTPKEPTINNEAVEVIVHPATGGIRAVHDINQRGNLLSQQLAFRLPPPRPKPGDLWRDPDLDAVYSRMKADSVEVTAAGPAFSQIVSRGRLVDSEGARLAGFVQHVELWRGTRVALVEIELDIDRQPRADAWNSYYACRFAWGDDSAELRRSVGLTSQLTDARNLEAPYFIDVKAGRTRAVILTGGCAYHRRVGQRMLDTLLVARGDTRRRFRLGISAGLAHPAAAALALVDPLVVVDRAAAPKTPTGWLFHLDAKNVVATRWSPLGDGGAGSPECGGGPPVGFRARLWETEGRAGRVHLRCFRPVKAARQIDLRGETVLELNVSGDQVAIDFAPYEWLEIEGTWTA
jgi:alpha-mannosidase